MGAGRAGHLSSLGVDSRGERGVAVMVGGGACLRVGWVRAGDGVEASAPDRSVGLVGLPPTRLVLGATTHRRLALEAARDEGVRDDGAPPASTHVRKLDRRVTAAWPPDSCARPIVLGCSERDFLFPPSLARSRR